jgi:3-keto-disaccharide hydrolase/Carboxypeptidase regulatory-like domain/FG-GAP-like repeat/CARDB
MRSHICRFLIFVFLIQPLLALSSVEDGGGWLSVQQQSDGGVYSIADTALPYQSTAEVVKVSFEDIQLSADVVLAEEFLKAKLAESETLQTEFVAKALVLELSQDVLGRDLLTELKKFQNGDGGFGDQIGYESTVYDTVFALTALNKVDTGSYEESQAVLYLLNAQNLEGSWGLNGLADTTLTALSTQVLWEYRHRFADVPNVLQLGMQYLVSQQLNELWASDAQTAQTLLAILPMTIDADATAGNVAALTAQQQLSGAWSEDVYSTALALRALLLAAQPRINPDLVAIEGQILDGDTDLPLVNVSVVLSGDTSQSVQTGAQGMFGFGGLQAGSFSLSIQSTGYSGVTWEGQITAGETRDLGQIRLVRTPVGEDPTTAFIQGQVTDATSGSPLPDVSIMIDGTDLSVLTDTDGNYLMVNVAPGQIMVSAHKQGYSTVGGTANVTAGQVLLFSPALYPVDVVASQITGVITGSNTGAPLSGINVSIGGANQGTELTDSSGYYQFSDLSPGLTTLLVSGELYHDVTASVDVQAGVQYDASVALQLLSDEVVTFPAALTGMVAEARGGSSLVGVDVELAVQGETFIQQTDDEGGFYFSDLPAGNAVLTLRKADFFDRQITLSLENSIITDVGKIELQSNIGGYGFGGVVVDSTTNLAISNVMVTVDHQNGTTTLMTDNYGQFYLEGLNDPDVALAFEKNDYVSVESVPLLEPGVVTDLGQIRLRYSGYTSFLSDLVVTDVNTGSILNDPETLSVDGLLSVTINNQGLNEVSTDFDITAFYDVDSDGVLGDQDIALGNTRYTETLNGEAVVSFDLDGQLPYRDAPITVAVDVNSEVVESDETNNNARSSCAKSCVLLEDNFNDGDAAGWNEIPNQIGSVTNWSVVSGVYDAHGQGGGAFVGDLSWENYTAETRIRFPEGASNDAGLLFRYQDVDNWYQFRISSSEIRIISQINGEINEQVQSASLIIDPARWYTLKVDLDGTQVKAYLDDDLIFDYNGLQLGTGAVGYMDDGVHVQYDDLTVSECSSEFIAQLEWHWVGAPDIGSRVFGPVNVAQVTDDNADGIIDDNDVPDVIALVRNTNNLVAISGDTGETIWANSQVNIAGFGSSSVADIDGDGVVEILSVSNNRSQIYAFEHTGELKWSTPTGPGRSSPRDAISIADLNHDGSPEIIHGRRVYSSDGQFMWGGAGHHGGEAGYGIISIAADIDLSGDMEVIAGATAYNSDGTIKWHQSSAGTGFNAIGNFDDDDYAEIVLISSGKLYVLEHTGDIKWGPVSIGGGFGGAPTVADVDGDGEPEIGIAGSRYFSVFETDGSLKWRYRVNDLSSSRTGSSVFDFQADGQAELVYADERYLRVFDGETGEVLFYVPNRSGTTLEYPVIADIDNDGSAEILFAANDGSSSQRGLKAFGSVNNDWVDTRSIWNQHSYHINNIDDDGTVPTHEEPSWLGHNTYRLNRFVGAGAQDSYDLTLSLLQVADSGVGNPLMLSARIGNAGALPSLPSKVSFYKGGISGELIGEVALSSLQADTYIDIQLGNVTGLSKGDTIVAVVNEQGSAAECNNTNNSQQILADAILGEVTVNTDRNVYLFDTNAFFTASIANTGVFTSDYQLIWHIEDANGVQVVELLGSPVNGLISGGQETYSLSWNTGQTVAGSYRIKASLLTTSGKDIDVDAVDFVISATDIDGNIATAETAIATDKPAYNAWDNVQLDGHILNNALNVELPDATAVLVITAPNGDELLNESFPVSSLAAQALQPVSSLLNLSDAESGLYQIRLDLISNADDSLLSMAAAIFSVERHATQALLGSTTADPVSVERGGIVDCTDVLTNRSATMVSVSVEHLLLDTDNQQIVSSTAESVILQAGQGHTHIAGIETATLPMGGYSCVQQVTVGGETTQLSYAGFTVTVPPIVISSDIGEKGRLLILLDDPLWVDPGEQSGLDTQYDYLRALLDIEGYSYTIVFTASDFDREMATGNYHSYALMSEQVTLNSDTEQVLGEAVNSGAGLLISGAFNRRNNHIERALGIFVTGNESQSDGVLIPSGALGGGWSETTITPATKLDFERCGAQVLATYISPVKNNKKQDATCYDLSGIAPAAAEYQYGKGHGVYIGFDTLDEAALIGGDNTYSALLKYSLASIQPDEFVVQRDRVVPLLFSISSEAVTADINISVDLPTNVGLLVDSLPTLTLTDEDLNLWQWQGELLQGVTRVVTLYVKLLDDNPASVTLQVEASANDSVFSVTQLGHLLEPEPWGTPLADAVTLLQALSQQDTKNQSLSQALSKAQSAQNYLAANNIDAAISNLLQSVGKLADESSEPVQQARLLLDQQLFALLAIN